MTAIITSAAEPVTVKDCFIFSGYNADQPAFLNTPPRRRDFDERLAFRSKTIFNSRNEVVRIGEKSLDHANNSRLSRFKKNIYRLQNYLLALRLLSGTRVNLG